MDVEHKNQLKSAMWKIIDNECLSKPQNISIRSPLLGVRRTAGNCRRSRLDGSYRLIVSTTKSKFVQDDNGKYVSKKTGQRMRRLLGVSMSDKEIVHTAAHEIAHLKFWNHTPEHLSYTEHLFKKLYEELRWEVI